MIVANLKKKKQKKKNAINRFSAGAIKLVIAEMAKKAEAIKNGIS